MQNDSVAELSWSWQHGSIDSELYRKVGDLPRFNVVDHVFHGARLAPAAARAAGSY